MSENIPDHQWLKKRHWEKLKTIGVNKVTTKREAHNAVLKKLRSNWKKWETSELNTMSAYLDYKERMAFEAASKIPSNFEEDDNEYGLHWFEGFLDKAILVQQVLDKVQQMYDEIEKDWSNYMNIGQDNPVANFFRFRAINFKNILNYNQSVLNSIEEIVVFEYMLYRGLYFKKMGYRWFYHTKDQFLENIKIKTHRLDKVLEKLEVLGFIEMKNEVMPRKRYFMVNIEKIISALPNLLNSYRKTDDMS